MIQSCRVRSEQIAGAKVLWQEQAWIVSYRCHSGQGGRRLATDDRSIKGTTREAGRGQITSRTSEVKVKHWDFILGVMGSSGRPKQ